MRVHINSVTNLVKKKRAVLLVRKKKSTLSSRSTLGVIPTLSPIVSPDPDIELELFAPWSMMKSKLGARRLIS